MRMQGKRNKGKDRNGAFGVLDQDLGGLEERNNAGVCFRMGIRMRRFVPGGIDGHETRTHDKSRQQAPEKQGAASSGLKN